MELFAYRSLPSGRSSNSRNSWPNLRSSWPCARLSPATRDERREKANETTKTVGRTIALGLPFGSGAGRHGRVGGGLELRRRGSRARARNRHAPRSTGRRSRRPPCRRRARGRAEKWRETRTSFSCARKKFPRESRKSSNSDVRDARCHFSRGKVDGGGGGRRRWPTSRRRPGRA